MVLAPGMPLRRVIIGCGVVLLLVGCASTPRGGGSPIARIEANRPLFESWPIEVREAILDQRVISGMAPAMVRMALGEPAEITYAEHPRQGHLEETWIYRRTSGGGGGGPAVVRNTSVTVGAGPGGVYVGGGPAIGVGMGGGGGGGAFPDEDRVIFLHGRVVRSTMGP